MRALLLALFLSACSAPSGEIPRFYEVDAGKVYRSAQPTEQGYTWLSQKGILTVIKLNTEQAADERAWAKATGIHLIEVPMSGLFAPEEDQARQVLGEMENKALQPVLVHCTQGQDRTGLAVALYRVYGQMWKPEDALKEWKDKGHSPFLFTMDWFFSRVTNPRSAF